MRKLSSKAGFSVVEVVVVVAVVAILVALGFAGYNAYHNQQAKTTGSTGSTSDNQSPVARNVSAAPVVNSTASLDNALSVLDQNDPGTTNATDSSQLDNQANF